MTNPTSSGSEAYLMEQFYKSRSMKVECSECGARPSERCVSGRRFMDGYTHIAREKAGADWEAKS